MIATLKTAKYTVTYNNGVVASVRDNKTGKFVKHSLYFALENKTTSDHGVTMSFFSVVSLILFVTSIFKTHYKANGQVYYDAKIAVMLMVSALPVIFVFGQAYKLFTSLFCAVS